MNQIIMSTEKLPLFIRERLRAPRASVQERDGGVILMPIREGSGLRGIASQSSLTTEKLRAYKNEDMGLDK
jgi:hypothetical protein